MVEKTRAASWTTGATESHLLNQFSFLQQQKMTIFIPNQLFVRAQRPETLATRELETHGWTKIKSRHLNTQQYLILQKLLKYAIPPNRRPLADHLTTTFCVYETQKVVSRGWPCFRNHASSIFVKKTTCGRELLVNRRLRNREEVCRRYLETV